MSLWSKALVLVTLAAVFFQGKVVTLTAYSLLALYFGSRYALRYAVQRLQGWRVPARQRLFPGETTMVRLSIKNESPFPLFWALVEDEIDPNLKAEHEEGPRFGVFLAPRDESVVEYPIQAKSRGVYTLGPMRLVTGDPLGFDEAHVRMVGETEILVYPRIYPLDALGLGGYALTGAARPLRKRFEDPTRMAGIRDYAPGESVRHIHWKATAHTRSLKVKTFDPTEHDDLIVVLDLMRERYRPWNVGPMSELAIETAASLLAEAARRRQAFGFYVLGDLGQRGTPLVESGVQKGDPHLGRCLELLARVSLGEGRGDVASALEQAAKKAGGRTTLVVVAPALDPAARMALMRIKNRGGRVLAVEVSDEPADEALFRGIQSVRIGYRGDIARTLAAGRQKVAAIDRPSTA